MSQTSVQKAAFLLMGLDPAIAGELLRSAAPQTLTEIVAELAYLNASGVRKDQASLAPALEFCGMLAKGNAPGSGQRFLNEMLTTALGKDKSKEVISRLDEYAQQRDPFLAVRALEAADLAKAIAGESPQVAALVLAELPPRKSAELLGLLDEKVRLEAVRGLTCGEDPPAEVKRRVAGLVLSRVRAPEAKAQERREQQLRKTAVLLRGLTGERRTPLVQAIAQTDPETAKEIQRMMVTWDDIVSIAERSLQEALRGMESKRLALALIGADAAIIKKLRSNMSERAAAMLDEETSLLSKPQPPEIEKARESILSDLRELNANNMLSFNEG